MAFPEPGDRVRKALAFICEERASTPEVPLFQLIDKASLCFDLTPLETLAVTKSLTVSTPSATS